MWRRLPNQVVTLWRRRLHAGSMVCRRPNRPQRQTFADILRQNMEEELRRQKQSSASYPQHVPHQSQRTPWMQGQYARIPTQQNSFGRQAGGVSGQHPRLVLLLVIAGGAGIYYVVHLEQVPATGRWRFLDVSIVDELRMGDQAYQSTMQEYAPQIISNWSSAGQQVNRVAKRIIAACRDLDIQRAEGAPETEWTVHVVDDPTQKNAFVLPGGHIFVFTGILPVCANDDGLATVMAHEIAHQLARHSAEKMAGTKILMAGAFALDMLGLDIGISRILLNLLLSLPNSRKIESEADQLGLKIMSKACYNPDEAVSFWERMDKSEAHQGKWAESAKALLSTHPVNSQRIANIKSWLPDARNEFQQNRCSMSQALPAMLSSAPWRASAEQ